MITGKANILLVEDNDALRGVISFNLMRAGYQVTVVTNGREALDALQHGPFDLVLSDQQMPKMTGIQLCEQIRELPQHQHLPFILLTAKYMELDLAKLRQRLRLSAALPKPFSPSELLTCIEECLSVASR
ncbi:MAG TPA: response regulator [Lacipirellulaceae bacterium]|jgi:two-component system chemotaxis response regulator CheY